MMPRRLLGLRIALAFSGLLVAGGVALAQPVAPPTARPSAAPTARPNAAPTARPNAAPTSSANAISPITGLPGWHPPVGGSGPAPQAQPPMRPGHDQKNVRQLVEQLKREPGGVMPTLASPSARKFPTDEHGYCIGQGPNDPPKNVNLFHGWLGVNNEKAVPAPQRLDDSSPSWFAARFGSTAWWKWRLTPHPWRYENHDDECDPRNTPIPLLANLINFGLLMWLVTRFGGKPIAEALKKRRSAIMSEIDRAKEIKASAKGRLDQYAADLDKLDDKQAALRLLYAEEGELDEKHLREELGQARTRMLADADFRVVQEAKSTRDTLSREALEGALVAAEALLGDSINDDDHNRLCEEFLNDIGNALVKGASDGRATGAAS